MKKEHKDTSLKKLIEDEINLRQRWENCKKEFEIIISDSKSNNYEFRKWWILNAGDKDEVIAEINKKAYRIKKTDKMTFGEGSAPTAIDYENIIFFKL